MKNIKILKLPVEVGNLTEVVINVKHLDSEYILSENGKVIEQFHNIGVTDQLIKNTAKKFEVKYTHESLNIEVPDNELKMGKDKLLQCILILNSSNR